MASKDAEIKKSANETHTTAIGNGASYRKSDGDFAINESGSGLGSGNGVVVEEINEMDMDETAPSSVELATALQKIEGRKTKWYAYLTTRDFWIVIVLGYVLCSYMAYLLRDWMLTWYSIPDKSSPFASLQPTPSPLSLQTLERTFPPSRLSLITYFSCLSTQHIPSTGTASRGTLESSL